MIKSLLFQGTDFNTIFVIILTTFTQSNSLLATIVEYFENYWVMMSGKPLEEQNEDSSITLVINKIWNVKSWITWNFFYQYSQLFLLKAVKTKIHYSELRDTVEPPHYTERKVDVTDCIILWLYSAILSRRHWWIDLIMVIRRSYHTNSWLN